MSVIIPGLITLINDIDILCRRGLLPSGRGIAGAIIGSTHYVLEEDTGAAAVQR